ncbi:MAG: PAS domain S-box protein [Lysobacteraceae bacterium]
MSIAGKTRILYVYSSPAERDRLCSALAALSGEIDIVCVHDQADLSPMAGAGPWGMALYDVGSKNIAQFPHLQTIRALDAEMPVLLLADDGASSIAADALYHGAWSGIVKTAEHLRLLPDIVVAALEKRRDIAQLQAQVGSLANSQRLDATLESMSSAFLAFDCNWNYTYVNAHAGKLFGRAPEDLVGKHLWTEFPEGVGQPFHRVYERVMQTGEQEEFVDYYPTSDRWFLKRVIPTGDGLSIFFDDITAQKQAELQLAASERHLRAIIDTEPECVKLLAKDGALLDMNPAGLRMLEADSLQQVQNHSVYPLIAQPYRRAFQTMTNAVFTGGSGTLAFEVVGLKGGRRWLETHASPLRDNAGKVIALLGITRDISERKQAELLAKGEQQVLELIADGAPLEVSLEALARLLEQQSDDCLVSILLLDDDGVRLRHGAAPSLPDAFNRAIDGETIGPNVGSCGTAAFLAETVIVEDIASDPLWADYRELALSHGLRACWSTPLLDAADKVMGTFAIYRRTPSQPTQRHQQLIEVASHIAVIAITHACSEQSLRRSEESLRLALDAAQMGMFDWDIARDRIIWSRWHAQLWGYAPGEFDGSYQAFAVRVHADDRPALEAAIARCTGDRTAYSGEFRVVWPDASTHWIDARGEFDFAAEGQPVRMRGVAMEITARKRAEEALRESEAFLAAAQSRSKLGNWSVDPNTLAVTASAELYRMFDRDPALGRLTVAVVEASVHPDDRDAWRAQFAASLVGRNDIRHEYRIIRPNGEIRWIERRAEMQFDASGQPTLLVGTKQDITERKLAQREMHEQLLELRRWQALLLDRADREMTLKGEVNQLLALAGQPIRYPSQGATPTQ